MLSLDPINGKFYYIYQITNLINNKFYIGKRTSKKHPLNDDYMGSGILINRAIKKYGIENFTKDIICFCVSKKDLNETESNIITPEFIHANKDICYNLMAGGQGGDTLSSHPDKKIIYQKISKSNKGRLHSEATKDKIRKKKEGKHRSYTSRKKQSQSTKGIPRGPFTKEHKMNISKSRIGFKQSKETILKISKAIKDKICINNKGLNKYISPNELSYFIKIGWTKGRIFKPNRKKISDSLKGKITIFNTITNKCTKIKEVLLEDYIQQGWVKGKGNDYRENKGKLETISKIKDTIWIYKNLESKRVKKEEKDFYISMGWSLGRNV